MAPPTPILCKDQIQGEHQKLVRDSKFCSLKSLTQYQCNITAYSPEEYICVPFKRLFEECITANKTNKRSFDNGKSQKQQKVNPGLVTKRVELTSRNTNS
ncbi:hypothetical protein HG535_0G03040 [Zygotorulaspora mrakii]|uniref:Uncharacterized protein n=1 Tax=Zygotorulaspora mrakii TaxID=42260 RepID=A0A7H9B6V5_ZYGMR|nr:uncharacterized protein HG535_0G03040 [Zygotorulaspora mrakii]QLG74421.1 hypothetical protein HG535_0G03040 [Zygotorulaspora mrakii]